MICEEVQEDGKNRFSVIKINEKFDNSQIDEVDSRLEVDSQNEDKMQKYESLLKNYGQK